MVAGAQRFEFRSTYDANDGSGRTGLDTSTSDILMPDMTDKNVNEVFEKNAQARAKSSDVQRVAWSDEQREARTRVVNTTAKALSSGVLTPTSDEAQIVRAAIEHQLKVGGASAADALAQDISVGLPRDMKLEIRPDAAFEQKVKEYCAKHNEPVPTYIRLVELKNTEGKVIGSVGITGDANAHQRR